MVRRGLFEIISCTIRVTVGWTSLSVPAKAKLALTGKRMHFKERTVWVRIWRTFEPRWIATFGPTTKMNPKFGKSTNRSFALAKKRPDYESSCKKRSSKNSSIVRQFLNLTLAYRSLLFLLPENDVCA